MSAPLEGIKVVELAGMGPGPFAAMLLADLGATVLRVDKPADPARKVGIDRPLAYSPDFRSRYTVTLDLKDPQSVNTLLELVDEADVLIDVFRPGVAERLGIGPEVCLERNPRLVYGRMTGWGQTGPLAPRVGHDLNYIGLTGALDAIGRAGHAPAIPLALVGDYAGGALYLTLGVMAALMDRERSGLGQIVDAGIVDGVVNLAALVYGYRQQGAWNLERGTNLIDTGCPYYDVYPCSDGRYLAFAPIEKRFYGRAITLLGLDSAELPSQEDESRWGELRTRIGGAIAQRTLAEWTEVFDGEDACVTPVLTLDEAMTDPHLAARGDFVEIDGVLNAAPAPKLSRTPLRPPTPPVVADCGTITDALSGWLTPERITRLTQSGVFAAS